MFKKVFGRIFLLSLILTMPLCANAQGKFSNAVTNLDFTYAPDGKVKVNIYTKNPVTQKVLVEKKTGNKYVILIPETDNWMKTEPQLTSVQASVKNIEMKTQAGKKLTKGYTKIVLESEKPVVASPQPVIIKPKFKPTDTIKPAVAVQPAQIIEKAVPLSLEPSAVQTQIAAETSVAATPQPLMQPISFKTTAVAAPITQPVQKPIIRPVQKTFIPKNFPVEIIDIPQPKNIIDGEYSEDYLIVPLKQEQKEETKNPTVKIEEISKALMKDTPKQLSFKSKFQFKPFKNIKQKLKKLLSWEYNLKLLKLAFKVMVVLILLGVLVGFLYAIFRRKKEPVIISNEESASVIENEELKKAIEEFEKAEESVQKLEPKPYIKDIDSYRNLDGFKKDEVSDDILKTLDAIEKAQKTSTPFTPMEENNKLMSFNANGDKYLFKNPLEDLTEDEEKALFDEDDEIKPEDETLTSKYYNSNDEIFIVEDKEADDEFFIIEDEDETEEENTEIKKEEEVVGVAFDTGNEETKEDVISEQETEIQPENDEYESEPDIENLKVKVKYEIDDVKGISLVKYHDITALIGYIGSEIILLKRFDNQTVPEELSVRLSEQVNEETRHYIVKVGNFKYLVEVKPLSIRLLLSL